MASSSVARAVQELTLNSCSRGAKSTTVCRALHSAHARHQGSPFSASYSSAHRRLPVAMPPTKNGHNFANMQRCSQGATKLQVALASKCFCPAHDMRISGLAVQKIRLFFPFFLCSNFDIVQHLCLCKPVAAGCLLAVGHVRTLSSGLALALVKGRRRTSQAELF